MTLDVISARDAKAAGLKFCFTGKPCKSGHIALRFAGCNKCTECAKAQSKDWYADKERSRQKTAKWRAENPDKSREHSRAWRLANPDKIKRTQKKYRAKDPEAAKARCRAWYARNIENQRARGVAKRQANLEKSRAYSRTYNANNKEKVAAHARKRRAQQRAGGSHTEKDVAEIFKSQRGKCAYCRIKVGRKYHVDHIVALVNGGSNDRRNIQILCPPCNQTKNRKDPIVFAQSLGMLL